MLQIDFNNDHCGAGKTHALLTEFATEPGRYLYAIDRREQIEVRHDDILKRARERGVQPPLISYVCSDMPGMVNTSKNVSRDIGVMGKALSESPHCVLIICHEALKAMDHGPFAGWDVVIDEDPMLHEVMVWNIPASAPSFAQNFDIEPTVTDGVYRVVGKPGRVTASTYGSDSIANMMQKLETRVQSHDVFTSLPSWKDTKVQFVWWSHWHPDELKGYRRVRIVANNFRKRITYKLLTGMFADRYTLRPYKLSDARQFLPRDVRIEYFAENHHANNAAFSDPKDKGAFLQAINAYVDGVTTADNHLYCFNSYNELSHFEHGTKVSSKVAGSNSFEKITAATIIYTAKGSKHEELVYRDFHKGVSPREIIEDREDEDIIQIALRTSLRTPDDTRPVTIRLYDRRQAEMLAAYLWDQYRYSVEVVHVPVQVEDYGAAKLGRKPKGERAMSEAERKRKSRAEAKVRKEAEKAVPAKVAA